MTGWSLVQGDAGATISAFDRESDVVPLYNIVVLIGFVLWVMHLIHSFLIRSPTWLRWLGWAWAVVLPLLVAIIYTYWYVAVPRPVTATLFAPSVGDEFFGAVVLGFAEWVLFWLLEPVVALARWFLTRRRLRSSPGTRAE